MRKKVSILILVTFFTASFISVNCYADGEAVTVSASPPKAEVLMEASTGQVLHESASHEKIHAGSLAKLMTMLIVAEKIESGTMSEDTVVTAGKNAFSANGAVIWLETGEKMSVGDLLKGVIIGNANDASIALAEHISGTEKKFVGEMNARAAGLGMKNTMYSDCTGTGTEKQYTTAYDTALLTRELLNHDIIINYTQTYMDELRGGETQLVNVNTLIRTYNGATGVKAGYSGETGYNLAATATRDGSTYITVIIGCEEKDTATAAGKALLDKGFTGFELKSPTIPQEMMKPLTVKGGTLRSVLIYPEALGEVVIPKGMAGQITYEIDIPEYVDAPVEKGQSVGEIRYMLGDEEILRTQVLTSSEVKEMNVWYALCKLLKSMTSF